jgi:hypothetical protein
VNPGTDAQAARRGVIRSLDSLSPVADVARYFNLLIPNTPAPVPDQIASRMSGVVDAAIRNGAPALNGSDGRLRSQGSTENIILD